MFLWLFLGYMGGLSAIVYLAAWAAGLKHYQLTASVFDRNEWYHRFVEDSYSTGIIYVITNSCRVKRGPFLNTKEWCFGICCQMDSDTQAVIDIYTFKDIDFAPRVLPHRVLGNKCVFNATPRTINPPVAWQRTLAQKLQAMYEPRRCLVAIICGKPGIGKSYFAYYLAMQLRGIDVVRTLSASQMHRAPAFQNGLNVIEEIECLHDAEVIDGVISKPNKSMFNITVDCVQTKTNTALIFTSNLTPDELRKHFDIRAEAMFRPGRVDFFEWIEADALLCA